MSYSPETRGGGVPVDRLPEEQRNRLLRRADWRFLAPGPRPARSICFAGGQLAQAVDAISGQVIESGRGSQGDCDLAAAVNPNAATLRKAWLALRPGGRFYGEWYAPRAGGAHGLRKALETQGFTDVACYWPWPIPDRAPAQFWLPVEAPQALRYFLAN